MARTLRSDNVLFWETVALVCASLVMLYSASAVVASNRGGSPYGVFLHQLPWAMLSLVALLVIMRVDYHVLRKPEVIWPVVVITVLALMAVFLFPPRKGATRWITLFGLNFQPSELAKLVAVVFSAVVLEKRMHRIDDVKWALGPVLLVAGGLAALVVAQRDIGTPVVLVLAVGAMMVSAGLAWRYLIGLTLVALPVMAGLILMHPYRVERLMSFIDPKASLTEAGYQLWQSKIALGVGGVLGVGLGKGIQKLSFLPEPENDFIFAVIGEELGLLGTTAMVVAFAVIAWRGLRASLLAPDRFGSLLGVGLTMMIAVQALLNISVVTGLAPTKGLPLPLVSAGGSSLLMNMIAMGILLNISQQASSTAHAAIDR
jgi:cell division protein FtsW